MGVSKQTSHTVTIHTGFVSVSSLCLNGSDPMLPFVINERPQPLRVPTTSSSRVQLIYFSSNTVSPPFSVTNSPSVNCYKGVFSC